MARSAEKIAFLDRAGLARSRYCGVRRTLNGPFGYAFAFAALSVADDPEIAARLIGAADKLFSSVGAEVHDTEREKIARTKHSLAEKLSPDRFAAAIRAGGAAPLEEIVALARR